MSDTSVTSLSAASTPKDSINTDPHQDAVDMLLDGKSDWDQRLIRWSNWVNPILVKETRQALKSKQFSWTYGLLVFVILAWSLFGIVSSIPTIYYASDGRGLLSGYLIILIVPAWLIIPQVAFRSMASELDDGTFETLSLSMLRPHHILLGKLNVAALQLIVYLSVVTPCIALTYLLRGVTFEVIGISVLTTIVTTMTLAMIAIALASFARSRSLQVVFSLFLIAIQVGAIFSISAGLLTVIESGVSTFQDRVGYWMVFGVSSTVAILYSWVLFACACSLIGVSSDNKSTRIRVPLLVIGIFYTVFYIWAISISGETLIEPGAALMFLLLLHWGIAGSFMMGERGFISMRAKRSLPNGILSKVFFTWFIPGAGTAYLFVLASFTGSALSVFIYSVSLNDFHIVRGGPVDVWELYWNLAMFLLASCCYLALFLGMARLGSLLLFRNLGGMRIFGTGILSVVIVTFASIFSCFVCLMQSNFERMDYSYWCFLNPFWTLSEIFPNQYQPASPEGHLAVALLVIVTVPIFLTNLVIAVKDVVIQRIETPPRVLAERAKINRRFANTTREDEIVDPLA